MCSPSDAVTFKCPDDIGLNRGLVYVRVDSCNSMEAVPPCSVLNQVIDCGFDLWATRHVRRLPGGVRRGSKCDNARPAVCFLRALLRTACSGTRSIEPDRCGGCDAGGDAHTQPGPRGTG